MIAIAALSRPIEYIRTFFERFGMPSDRAFEADMMARAKQAQEAGDPGQSG